MKGAEIVFQSSSGAQGNRSKSFPKNDACFVAKRNAERKAYALREQEQLMAFALAGVSCSLGKSALKLSEDF